MEESSKEMEETEDTNQLKKVFPWALARFPGRCDKGINVVKSIKYKGSDIVWKNAEMMKIHH